MVAEVLKAGLEIFCAVEEYAGSNQSTGRVEIIVVVEVTETVYTGNPRSSQQGIM